MTVAVVGAGLAGLAAAATLAEAGTEFVLFEAGDEPGGTTALSSGWVWRYRDLATFAWGAPHGDRDLQRVCWEALPDALIWLERAGMRRLATGTSNPLTEGVRIDGRQATQALARRLPKDTLRCNERVVGAERIDDGIRLRTERSDGGPDAPTRSWDVSCVIFAGGGYGADLERIAREAGAGGAVADWAVRNAGLSDGSSMDAALALGAQRVPVNGESYTRAMPVGVQLWPDDYVRFSQVYGEHAWALGSDGTVLTREEHDWSDTRLVWSMARRTGRGWYVLDREALGRRTPYGPVSRSVREAEAAGALVLAAEHGGLADLLEDHGAVLGASARARAEAALCAVAVRPGITHTMCGLRVDEHARVLVPGGRGRRERGLPDVLAAGVDVGGIGTGGYASGLAQALVLGRIAGAAASGANA